MDLTFEDIVEILQIVDASGFSHVTIEDGAFKLCISRNRDGRATAAVSGNGATEELVMEGGEPEHTATVAPPILSTGTNDTKPGAVEVRRLSMGGLELVATGKNETAQASPTAVAVRSPMLGVFYRRPAPDAPAFVELGQRLAAGDTVCLVESMKMFMPVPTPVGGFVVGIPVENKDLVEFDQEIMWIEPEAAE